MLRARRRPRRLIAARFWHRRARVGQHRPLAAVYLDSSLVVHECACGAVGISVADLAVHLLGEPEPHDILDADEIIWVPRHAWQAALDAAW